MSIRAEKVASVIKRALSEPVSTIARENSAGIVTVTTVKLSPDLQIAKVYISVYGKKYSSAEFVQILDNRKGELRKIVGNSVRLRTTPDVKFFIDDTLDQMDRIQVLLDNSKKFYTSEDDDTNE